MASCLASLPARLACAVLACAVLAWPAAAQRAPLDEPRFESIGDVRSINDAVVTALAEDHDGLIWIGTTVGVVRYDGYQLKRYPITAEGGAGPASGTSFVRALVAAPGGQLWAALEGEGLARLDLATHRWTLFPPDPDRPGALASGAVRSLALDHDGVLWAGTIGGGLHSLAPGADRFQRHDVASGALPDDRIQALWVDPQGGLWVGTWAGLVRRPRGGAGFERVFSGGTESTSGGNDLAGRIVSMIGGAPDGSVWAGTRRGDLAVIDPATGSGRWLEQRSPQSGESGGAFGAMSPAGEHEIWLGRERGIDVRDARDGRLLMRLERDLRKPWGLAGRNVAALLRDSAGALWVGSYGGGLQRHLRNDGLWVRRNEVGDHNVLVEADVRSLAQLDNGEIWAGTQERGVAILDTQMQLIGEIRPQPGAPARFAGLRSGFVGAIAQTPDGTVWLGTDSGVYAFDRERRFQRVLTAGQGRARRMLAALDGSLWVATQDGVHWLAAGGTAFERVSLADGGRLSGNFNALGQAADGTVWVGGNSGLFVAPPMPPPLPPPMPRPALQPVVSPPGAGLLRTQVQGLLVDRRQTLWVDTNAGLHRLEDWNGSEARFVPMVGAAGAAGQGGATVPAPSGSVGANLLDDEQGRIWTHQMLFDPRDGSGHELGSTDGVDIGTGWFRSYTALADGRLLFGGSTGILVVDPARYERWAYTPPLIVAELRIDGERTPVAARPDRITLSPGQRGFNLEFAALDYGGSERKRYRHRLHGFDSDWIVSDGNFRIASYAGLPPGRHRLQVQGSNRVGDWSPRELNLTVEVLPAWWQTWWARAVLGLLALTAVGALVQGRTAMLRRRQRELEQRVAERTEALQRLSEELHRKTEELEASSLTDPLTGLHNRRYLTQHIEADLAQSLRRWQAHGAQAGSGSPTEPAEADLVFFMLDLDHFKQINDDHGHGAGDAVLVQMRERLQHAFREADHLVRWGGEEFLVVARDCSRRQAADMAARACKLVAERPFVLDDGGTISRTCSIGFASWPLAPEHPKALPWIRIIDLADAALYAVKDGGRDGWMGIVRAGAPSAQALREAAAGPLPAWLARTEASAGLTLEVVGTPAALQHLRAAAGGGGGGGGRPPPSLTVPLPGSVPAAAEAAPAVPTEWAESPASLPTPSAHRARSPSTS